MFKIYFVNSAYEKDQVLMYDDTRDDDELKLGNPKLRIEVNAAGTLDFELPSTNVAYSRIIPMVTELHVIKDNQKTHDKHIWFGRVLTIDTDLYETKTIHCEGGLAYLNDCIYYDKSVDHGSWSNQKTVGRAIFARYESPTLNEGGVHVYGVSPNEASAVIANIMSGGSNYKENLNAPFKHLGRIAKDTDSDVPIYAWVNEPVVPSGDQTDEDYYFDEDNLNSTGQNQCGISNPNNMTAIDLISSMMSNVGGLFWVSKTPQYPKRTFGGANSGDAVYVMQLHMRRYYPAFNPDEGQTIQLGENLTDLTITDDGTTFFTAVHPHGQHVNSGEDFTLDRRGSQGGTTYVNKRNWKVDQEHGVMYCPELVKQYGMIIRDLDVGTTNMYEQLVGMGISEIDRIPIISKTVGGSWTSGVRELTVKGIDMSLYNADYSSIELTDAVRVLAPRHGIDTYLNVTAIDYDLQNVENTVFTLNAIKSSNEITNASPSYGSSSGPQSSGSSYVHPKHTEHDLGLYKFSNDNLGHVDSAVAVSKKDITALGIPSENTRYEITSSQLVSGGFFPDGPVIALKGTDGHHSYTASPNTYTVAITDAFNSYDSGEEIVSNGDKHRVILDLDIFAVNRFYEESAKWISYPIIIDSYITMSIQHIDKRFWVRIYTFARCNSNDMPTRAIVRQLDPNGQYSNIKWQVYSGSVTVTREGGIVTRFRIGIDSDAYGKISSITRPKVYTTNVTSAYGDTLGTLRHSMDINAIGVTAVDTILELSSQNASNVAFTGDYNDLFNKPAIPDISGKQDKLTAGANITISGNTISAKDTTYTSKSAVSGGTDVSLVTTGEKAIWNAKTSNVGTITGIKMNGASKGTSGVIDLGTVITAHQDISGKQDKSTAVTHSANTAVGSATKPVYIASNGAATAISHSINSDVPANAKFTDTTYNDATQSAHGLMTAADKKKLDGMDLTKYLPLAGGVMTGDIDMQANKRDILVGTHKATTSDGTAVSGGIIEKRANMVSTLPEMRSFIGSFHNTDIDRFFSLISVRHRNGHSDGNAYGMYIFSDMVDATGSLKWGKQTASGKWTDDFELLDSRNFTRYAAKSDHTHAMITNSAMRIAGANNAAKWYRLGVLVSSGNFSNAVIRVWSGDGANGNANQNSSFEVQIKDGWQSTESATKACAVTVYRINCSSVKVKVIPTAHDTYTVWVYLPWKYWNGNYAVYGRYKSWTSKQLIQSEEPEGTGADTAYYDHAFLTSTVAKATTLTDSGWIDTTRDISFAEISTVKCRKYGQLVEVRGEVTFRDTYGSPTVCTLPDGYRPADLVQTCGYTPSGKFFGIKVDTAGVVSFGSDSRSTFVKGTTYHVDLTYLLG